MRQRLLVALLFSLALLTSGCGGRVTGVEGREFSDPAEALAYLQSVIEQKLRQVEPLPAPIAGHAVVTISEQGLFEKMARDSDPSMDSAAASQFARLIEENALHLPRMIERRGIFQGTEILRVDNPGSALIPVNGYLIVYEFVFVDGRNQSRVKMGAVGESELQVLLLKRSPTSEDDMRLLFLEVIENYVETHPPSS